MGGLALGFIGALFMPGRPKETVGEVGISPVLS
jgi:hypothetical protein